MKKPQIFLSLFFAVLLFAACNPCGDREFTIKNHTGRDLTVLMSGTFNNGINNVKEMSPRMESTILSSVEGCTDRQSLEGFITHEVLGDSVQIVVDSVVVATWYPSDTLAAGSPYNFRSPHYEYYQHSAFHQCVASYNVYIWTLTSDMIDND